MSNESELEEIYNILNGVLVRLHTLAAQLRQQQLPEKVWTVKARRFDRDWGGAWWYLDGILAASLDDAWHIWAGVRQGMHMDVQEVSILEGRPAEFREWLKSESSS